MRELVVTSKIKQKRILEKVSREKKISPFSFLTKQELKERLYFRYDKRAIYYLVNQYHILVDNAAIYLDNMYYIEEKEYKSKKLKELQAMKQDLEEQGLLIHDTLFPYYLKKYMVVYDEACMTKFDEKIVTDLKQITDVTVVKEKESITYTHPVYEFATMEQEIDYIAKEIIKLYQKGVSFKQIKLVNAHSEYYYDIKRIFEWYHLPVYLKEQNSIYSTVVVSTFLEQLGTIPNDELLEQLKKRFSTEQDSIILNQITDVLSEYNWYDGDMTDLKEFFSYDFQQIRVPSSTYEEMIEVVDLEAVTDDDFVFFMGFNTDTVPNVLKDEGYITNLVAVELPCSTTLEQNKMNKWDMIRRINQVKHLVITYKNKGTTGECYPSSLIPLIQHHDVVCGKETLEPVSYSHMNSSMLLGRNLDAYYKYGVKSNTLAPLMKTFTPFPYQEFHHQYEQIPKELLLDYLKSKDGLTLSYTNMDKYMKCGFYYYLDCILKLDDYKETFMTLVGSYFHHMLEIARTENFNFEEETKAYFSEHHFSFKEQFLLEKLEEELKEVIEVVLYQESLSKHQNLYFEERIAVNYQYPIPVVMKGFIDKVMEYENNGIKQIALIDYKTGGFDISLDECIYGFHLQLPTYAYLIRHSEKFKDSILTGLYIAPILPNETLSKIEKDKMEQKIADMRLVGYSTDNISRLEAFDSTYEDSNIIKGMKVTSKGFGPYSKTLSDDMFDALVDLTEKKIKETIDHILRADFQIQPKYLKEKNMSCRFCPYHDVCYHDYNDYVYLKEEDYHTFLGGD